MALQSRTTDIWSVYRKYGGDISLHRLTQYCLIEGVWTPEEQHSLVFTAAQNACHQALQVKSPEGLPMAGSTRKQDDDGNARWRQLLLWDYDDALHNLQLRVRQTMEHDWKIVKALHHWMLERFGHAPAIPQWVMPDGEQAWWQEIQEDDSDEDYVLDPDTE